MAGVINDCKILLYQFETDGIVDALLVFLAPESCHGREMALWHINAQLWHHGQAFVMVLDHYYRAQLRLISRLHVFGVADDAGGLFGVNIGILEQPYTETVQQEPACAGLKTLARTLLPMVTRPHPIGFD